MNLCLTARSGAWFKSGDVVAYNGTLWLVWEERDKHVMVYQITGAVTVFPRAWLERIPSPKQKVSDQVPKVENGEDGKV